MKTKYFNKYVNPFLYLTAATVLLFFAGCSKDDGTPVTEPNNEFIESQGIAEEELGVDLGSIGILIDTRNIAKKGYLPAKAEISVEATEANLSQTIDIDPLTNLGRLAIPVKDLSVAALAELREGVALEVVVKDTADTVLKMQTFSAESFRENGTRLDIDATQLPIQGNTLSINPDIAYYMQLVVNGELTNITLEAEEPAPSFAYGGYEINILAKENNMVAPNPLSKFNLLPVSGKEDTYYIKVKGEDLYLEYRNPNATLTYQSNITGLMESFEFTFEIQESGNVRIKSSTGDSMQIRNQEIDEVRIIASTIKWEIESLVTKYMDPILPPANTSFGVNSTLSNCSSGTLEQEFSFEETIETTTTTGWEESIELSSESTTSFSATVGVSTSVEFFGSGVEVSAEATSGYSSTRGFTSNDSSYSEGTDSKSKTFSLTRTIEVLPGSAVLVYDAYQTYSDVEIPFVQRFRVRGSDDNSGTSLTGEQIKSQFVFNYFNGVITEVESDYVEVTVRGVLKLDDLVDARNDVIEVANNCDQ